MALAASLHSPSLVSGSTVKSFRQTKRTQKPFAAAAIPPLAKSQCLLHIAGSKIFLGNVCPVSVSSENALHVQTACRKQGRRRLIARAAAGGAEHVKGIDEPVLVVGATGGVGQIVVSYLLDRGHKVRAVLRNKEKGEQIFGHEHDDKLQMFVADIRHPDTLRPEIFEGVGSVISCTGTTAFPSKRWDGGKPEETDYHGFKNLLEKTPKSVKKFVMVSSAGVESYHSFPYNILNLFGVLKYKKLAEEMLEKSGHPFTIIRAGRLTDGPYTSYDLNTLLKSVSGTRRAVILSKGDKLRGEASRLSVAEACLQALQLESTDGQIYEINSAEGDGPGTDSARWAALFSGAQNVGQAKS